MVSAEVWLLKEGELWLPGSWVGLLYCVSPPSGDNNSQSVNNQPQGATEGTAKVEGVAEKHTRSAREGERQTEEGKGATPRDGQVPCEPHVWFSSVHIQR